MEPWHSMEPCPWCGNPPATYKNKPSFQSHKSKCTKRPGNSAPKRSAANGNDKGKRKERDNPAAEKRPKAAKADPEDRIQQETTREYMLWLHRTNHEGSRDYSHKVRPSGRRPRLEEVTLGSSANILRHVFGYSSHPALSGCLDTARLRHN